VLSLLRIVTTVFTAAELLFGLFALSLPSDPSPPDVRYAEFAAMVGAAIVIFIALRAPEPRRADASAQGLLAIGAVVLLSLFAPSLSGGTVPSLLLFVLVANSPAALLLTLGLLEPREI
jgi:hypothetical protein